MNQEARQRPLMQMADIDKERAIAMVCAHWRVRFFLVRERTVRGIADITWLKAAAVAAVAEGKRDANDPLTAADRAGIENACCSAVRYASNYQELRGFIPVWVFSIIIQIIVKLLIDYWLNKQDYVVNPY